MFYKFLLVLILYIDNFFNIFNLKSSLMHIFFLKLNSDNNIFLMYIYTKFINYVYFFSFNNISVMFWCFLDNILINNLIYNVNSNKLNLVDTNLNADLTNGLVLIHPIFLYSIIAFYLLYIHNFYINTKNSYLYNTFNILSKDWLLKKVIILIVSIYLGGWWAQLELSWGGWWSWDFVELVSLHYLIIIVFLLHNKDNSTLVTTIIWDFLLKLLLYILIVKFNFLDSIHNFVSQGIFEQNFYELVISYLFLLYILIFNKFLTKQNINYSLKLNVISTLVVLYMYYLYLYVYLEFFFIFNKESSLNGLIYKNKYFLYLSIIILFIYNEKLTLKFNLFFLSFWEFIYLQLLISLRYKKKLYLLHICIFILLYTLSTNFLFYSYFCSNDYNYLVKSVVFDNSFHYLHEIQNLKFNFNESEILFKFKYIINKNLNFLTDFNVLEFTKYSSFNYILMTNLVNFSVYILLIVILLFLYIICSN